jgi:uncharacterized protein YebE (UPF0316 family)
MESQLYGLLYLPLMIFFARIADVTLGTVRIISLSRGYKYLAPVLGFFEVLIWITVIGKIMQNLDHFYYFVAYAAGFATGNFVGLHIEEFVAMGSFIIRIIPRKQAGQLIASLSNAGFGATVIAASGATGPVDIVYSVIKRKDMKTVVDLIRNFDPTAFYSVEDVRYVSQGIFPTGTKRRLFPFPLLKQGK